MLVFFVQVSEQEVLRHRTVSIKALAIKITWGSEELCVKLDFGLSETSTYIGSSDENF
jgi:hypothetical protein